MTATPSTPAELIEAHQGLVHSLARKIHRGLTANVELDDLVGYGQVGLAEAANDFDPGRGAAFVTFAWYRVRGAIYDGLAQMSWFSRPQYHRLRCAQRANELLEEIAESSSAPAPATLDDDARWFADISRRLAVVYLATSSGGDDRGAIPLVDESAAAPAAVATGREISHKLDELIDALPTDAGTLIRGAYYEGLTLQEAGRRVGLSKSWASRLHAKTLEQLGRALKSLGVDAS